jgi:hypothetical protein
VPSGVIVVPTLTSSGGLKNWLVQLAVAVGRSDRVRERERERQASADRERSKLSGVELSGVSE